MSRVGSSAAIAVGVGRFGRHRIDNPRADRSARLLICKGAVVEGKVIAQEAVIEGHFKGTIHGNSVKLQATAVVDGEIFKQSLVIEQNAQFEGVSRRLEKAV